MKHVQQMPIIFVIIITNLVEAELVNQGTNAANTRIVGGYLVKRREDFPYQVSLRVQGQHICGGTIYAPRYVITAAHCLAGVQARHLDIVAGDLHVRDANARTQRQRAVALHVHANHSNIINDIAIVQLRAPLVFNPYVRSIPVYNASVHGALTPTTDDCVVSGWGATGYGGRVEDWLRAVYVAVYAQRKCMAAYPQNGGYVDGMMLCAGSAGAARDACTGDSGGPLVHNNSLVGIVSWGIDCGRPEFPGVYTNATYFSDWIQSNTNRAFALNARCHFLSIIIALNFVFNYNYCIHL